MRILVITLFMEVVLRLKITMNEVKMKKILILDIFADLLLVL